MRDRLASETEEERLGSQATADECQPTSQVGHCNWRRAARLQRMRDRLASETEEERAARLQQMSANQHHRLAAETGSEREARLQRNREGRRGQQSQLPLLNSPLFRLRCGSFCTRLRIHRIRAHARPRNALHSPSIIAIQRWLCKLRCIALLIPRVMCEKNGAIRVSVSFVWNACVSCNVWELRALLRVSSITLFCVVAILLKWVTATLLGGMHAVGWEGQVTLFHYWGWPTKMWLCVCTFDHWNQSVPHDFGRDWQVSRTVLGN